MKRAALALLILAWTLLSAWVACTVNDTPPSAMADRPTIFVATDGDDARCFAATAMKSAFPCRTVGGAIRALQESN